MEILLNVLKWSVAVGAVTLAVMALKGILDRRLSPKWRYWLWLVLAAALLLSPVRWENVLPAMPEPAVTVEVPRLSVPVARPFPASPSPDTNAFTHTGNVAGTHSGAGESISPVVPQSPAAASPDPEQTRSVELFDLISALWLLGAGVFVLWHLAGTALLARRVRRWSVPPQDWLLEFYGQICSELGVKRAPHIGVSRNLTSPMAVGLVCPRLWLPDGEYSERQLEFIFRHELTHVKRRDLWYKALMLLANALHWFNPLIWLMRREANETLELLCDVQALSGADGATRREYCETLLSNIRREKGAALTTHFYGGVRAVKNRFKNLLTGRSRRFGWAALTAGVLAVAVAACAVSIVSDSDDVGYWSVELTSEQNHDAIFHGITVTVGWENGDPVIISGCCDYVDSPTLSSSGVSFVVYQQAEEAVSNSILPIRQYAVYDVYRDNIISNKLENTPQLRAALAKVFRVKLNGETVPGELHVSGGNGHTDFAYVFDKPLEKPSDGDTVFISVGTEEWNDMNEAPAGAPIDADTLALWQERLNSPEWNGFVAQFYRTPAELDLYELLYLGGGVSRSLKDAEKALYDDGSCPWYAFDMDDVDAMLRERTGFGLDAVSLSRWKFIEDNGALIMAHGDTNYRDVTVPRGENYGETQIFTINDTEGRLMGELTVTDGKIVSFTNPVHAALCRAQEEYLSNVREKFGDAAGLDSWTEISPYYMDGIINILNSDRGYQVAMWSYLLIPYGHLDGADAVELSCIGRMEVTDSGVYSFGESGPNATVLYVDDNGGVTSAGTVTGAERSELMEDERIIAYVSGVPSEDTSFGEYALDVWRELTAGDYEIYVTSEYKGGTYDFTITPDLVYFDPDTFAQLLETDLDGGSFGGEIPSDDPLTLTFRNSDGTVSMTCSTAGDRLELYLPGSSMIRTADDGSFGAVASDMFTMAEYALESRLCGVTMNPSEDGAVTDAGYCDHIAAVIGEKIAENYRALPEWIVWKPADIRFAGADAFDVYLGEPGQICADISFYIKLASEDIDSEARMYWETGSGLSDPIGDGELAGYYEWGREFLLTQNEAGGLTVSDAGTGGYSVDLPGWTLSVGADNYLGDASLTQLLELMTLTEGFTHDHILPAYVCDLPASELEGLEEALAGMDYDRGYDIYSTIYSYLLQYDYGETLKTTADLISYMGGQTERFPTPPVKITQ